MSIKNLTTWSYSEGPSYFFNNAYTVRIKGNGNLTFVAMEAPIAPPVSEDKLFYTIGEVAAMFQVNTSLIRFWEKEFDVIKPRKNKKGNRLFTKEDLKNFRTIYYLVKERGYTLEGARQKLKGGKDAIDRDAEIAERLTKFRQFLVELRSSL